MNFKLLLRKELISEKNKNRHQYHTYDHSSVRKLKFHHQTQLKSIKQKKQRKRYHQSGKPQRERSRNNQLLSRCHPRFVQRSSLILIHVYMIPPCSLYLSVYWHIMVVFFSYRRKKQVKRNLK